MVPCQFSLISFVVERSKRGTRRTTHSATRCTALTNRQVITSVVEQFWLFDVTYSIDAFKGTGAEAGSTVELLTRTARSEIVTSGHPLRVNAPKVPARKRTHTHSHARTQALL